MRRPPHPPGPNIRPIKSTFTVSPLVRKNNVQKTHTNFIIYKFCALLYYCTFRGLSTIQES